MSREDLADVCHQRKEGLAVSDHMRYVLKPIAVRLENLVTSINHQAARGLMGMGLCK